ncbi:hemoglobin [Rhizobium sp. RU36D]|nr:hemoglobin [Rhizobium sp. RU36D]
MIAFDCRMAGLPLALFGGTRQKGTNTKAVRVSEETITLYEAIGGDATVRALAHRFYELMDTLPEAARCRAIHPEDLSGSEEKLYEYLSGYLGGPSLYIEKRGHPMLRRRHFVAEIGPVERDEWLLCFNRAMDDTIANPKLREIIRDPVERLALHMQNKE